MNDGGGCVRSGACVDEEVEALCLEEERAIQNVVFPLLRSSLRPSARSLAMDADGRPGGEPGETVQDLREVLNFSTRTRILPLILN